MSRTISLITLLPAGLAAIAFAFPLALPAHYHDFADTSAFAGLQPFGDAASNLIFLVAGGIVALHARHGHEWLLACALALTCAGSWYYHLAPDDARLLVDRLPMALAFAAMGAIALFPAAPGRAGLFAAAGSILLALAAIHACTSGNQTFWAAGQIYILLLVGLAAQRPEMRAAALSAFLLYGAAKLFETFDGQVLGLTGFISGHTIKHLLAGLAPIAFIILWRRDFQIMLSQLHKLS